MEKKRVDLVIAPQQWQRLSALHAATGLSIAALIRQALELLFAQHPAAPKR